MNDKKYNGWKNYETWVTALWIDNDYGSYQYRCELVEQIKEEHKDDEEEQENCLASSLKDWIEEQNPLSGNADVFVDLKFGFIWNRLARNSRKLFI
jgi:hypothetical protein